MTWEQPTSGTVQFCDAQYKLFVDAIADAARMQIHLDEIFRHNVAIAVAAFWKDAYPVLVQMTHEIVPRAMVTVQAHQANPWLVGKDQELKEAAIEVKRENPNGSYEENLQRAIDRLRPKEGIDG